MKSLTAVCVSIFCLASAYAQPPKTEVYDLIKKLVYDSTGYENVGDWAVGEPKTFPVKWQADRIEMSDDTSINFFRRGVTTLTVNNKLITTENGGAWNIMLKGPRMGYTSFSMISPASANLHPKFSIDSLFAGKKYQATLLKSCDTKPMHGYYFYELKIPKKDLAYLKISWITVSGKTAYRIDGYDGWSKHAAKLECR